MKSNGAYNLYRYEQTTEMVSDVNGIVPKIMQRCVQTHVTNKPYAICKFQKNILENFHKWPKGTYFTIEEVK